MVASISASRIRERLLASACPALENATKTASAKQTLHRLVKIMINIARLVATRPYRAQRASETRLWQKAITFSKVGAFAALLTGCTTGLFEAPEGFFGVVHVDEPHAALIARDTLQTGGNAADAATAAYFTLAATLPSSAGLGAYGSCTVFSPEKQAFERLTFYPQPSAASGRVFPLPVGPRGIFALHARYGAQEFDPLLAAAEKLARFGDQVSRALATDLAQAPNLGPAAAKLLMPNGQRLKQGDKLAQIDLAILLARLRQDGVGSLYNGNLSKKLVAAARSSGYSIDPARLVAALPVWEKIDGVEHNSHRWSIVAPDLEDTAFAESALGLILDGGSWPSNDSARWHVLAEALGRSADSVGQGTRLLSGDAADRAMDSFSSSARSSAKDAAARRALLGGKDGSRAGATAFFIADRTGMSVTCALGLGRNFGSGELLAEMGFAPAVMGADRAESGGAYALTVANDNTYQLHMLSSASGGRSAVSALLETALGHWELDRPARAAILAPRTHSFGDGSMIAEAGAQAATGGLQGLGYAIEMRESISRAGMFRCVEGIPQFQIDCSADGDPRALGLTLFNRN